MKYSSQAIYASYVDIRENFILSSPLSEGLAFDITRWHGYLKGGMKSGRIIVSMTASLPPRPTRLVWYHDGGAMEPRRVQAGGTISVQQLYLPIGGEPLCRVFMDHSL